MGGASPWTKPTRWVAYEEILPPAFRSIPSRHLSGEKTTTGIREGEMLYTRKSLAYERSDDDDDDEEGGVIMMMMETDADIR